MENLNSTELKVFNLIRSGKSRNEIIAEGFASTVSVQNALSGIYSKTEDVMSYHTARNKFEELSCFVRNNPEAFKDVPFLEDEDKSGYKLVGASEDETPVKNENTVENAVEPKEAEKEETSPIAQNLLIYQVEKAVGRISTKLKAKIEVLDEVCTEIKKELENAR